MKRFFVLIAFIFVVSGLLFFYIGASSDKPVFQYRWYRCIDRLADGSIYNGQPECEQPPLVFFVGWVLSHFGRSNIEFLSKLPLILLNWVILSVIFELIPIKTPPLAVPIGLIYCFSILPLTTECLASTFSLAFALLALLLLRTSRNLKSVFAASILLALSVLSKMIAVGLILGLVLAIILTNLNFSLGFKGVVSSLSTRRDYLFKVVVLLIPTSFTLLLLYNIYPNFFIYTVLSHAAYFNQFITFDSLRTQLVENVLSDFRSFTLYVVLLSVLLYFLKFKDNLAVVFMVSYLASFIALIGRGDTNLFATYYQIIPLSLLIVIIGKYINSFPPGAALMVISYSLVVFVLFVGNFNLYEGKYLRDYSLHLLPEYRVISQSQERLSRLLAPIRDKFMGFYSLIPRNSGEVVANAEMYSIIRGGHTNLDTSRVRLFTNPPDENRYFPSDYGAGLRMYNLSAQFDISPSEVALAREIDGGGYEMVFVGPENIDSSLSYALRNTTVQTQNQYCTVFIPAFAVEKNIRHGSTLSFRDSIKCNVFLTEAIDYDYAIFDDVCEVDEWAANYLLRDFFSVNTVKTDAGASPLRINKNCFSGVNTVNDFNNTFHDIDRLVNRMEVFSLFLIFLILSLATFWVNRGSGGKKRRKMAVKRNFNGFF